MRVSLPKRQLQRWEGIAMARGRKSSLRILLSPEEQATLEHWQRSTTIAAGRVRRGKIILLLAAGHSQSDVGRTVGVQRTVVRKWARRFLAQRLEGLSDAPGRGAKGFFPPRGGDPRSAPGLRATRDVGP
jgi:Helix-turn-helix domain